MLRKTMFITLFFMYSSCAFSQSWDLFVLNKKRKEILFNTNSKVDKSSKAKEILHNKNILNTDEIIIEVFNSDSTKFFAFMSCSPNSIGFEGSPIQKEDSIVFMGTHINSCIYLIAGIHSKTKWYVKKYGKTFKNVDSYDEIEKIVFSDIKDWRYFKWLSVKTDDTFWEKHMFSKIRADKIIIENEIAKLEKKFSKTKSYFDERKIYNKYQYLEEYKKYNGMHKIIVDELKENEKQQNIIFENNMTDFYFKPFFKNLVKTDTNYLAYKTHMSSNLGLVYPEDKKFIICPVLLQQSDNVKKVHFFVAIKLDSNKYQIFKWHYFEPTIPKYSHMFGVTTVDLLRQITIWDYSFTYLWEKDFFDTYIVLKENNVYKYLLEMH